jgi:signal recognition particle receptor subunit beta
MPHIDGRSGEVVIRIVYDGSPEAGKTTNVQQLLGLISLQRRGAAKSPGTTGPRTEFFDWLDFSGGYLDGRRVRCQLVSVPGQSNLLHRRRYLLETADAIVFVTDSRPGSVDASAGSFATTTRILSKVAGEVPVGVVLQANKQDHPGALPPADVARALGAAAETPVIASVASTGEGVMQTFVLAMRLATDRVRVLLLKNALAELSGASSDPDALYTAMSEVEAAVQREIARLEAERREAERREAQRRELETTEVEPPPPEVPARAPDRASDTAQRPNRAASGAVMPLLDAEEIGPGLVWPPVKGRAAIAAVASGPFTAPNAVRPWAPSDAFELVGGGGWTLHTTDRWIYPNESLARHRLIALVRRLLPELDALPEGRALAVAREGSAFRLWIATPPLPSLADEALSVQRDPAGAHVTTFLERIAVTVRQLGSLRLSSSPVLAGIAGLALSEGRLVVLGVDEGEDGPRIAATEPLAHLATTLEDLARVAAQVRTWLDAHGRSLLERANGATTTLTQRGAKP